MTQRLISRLLTLLFPYELPSRLVTMLAAQGTLTDYPRSALDD